MFKNIIVKRPCHAITEGITSAPELGKPVYEEALKQHDAYIETLKQCGTIVEVLAADEAFPDSCFVEDTAVLTDRCAILTNPGALTRKHEVESILPILKKYYPEECIEMIQDPGTLEGGDVMMVEDTFYVGLSARTNKEGIRQFRDCLAKYGYEVVAVPLEKVLHLKTGVNYIGENTMLVSGEFIDKPEFTSYKKIVIPETEAYAANCIRVNDVVIVPEGYPQVEKAIRDAGFHVMTTDTSEYRKIDGGLSCLSLRFNGML